MVGKWLFGLVPKQQTTGGAPAVADKHNDRRSNWIKKLDQRRGKNITAVAVANKNTLIAGAVLIRKGPYKAVA